MGPVEQCKLSLGPTLEIQAHIRPKPDTGRKSDLAKLDFVFFFFLIKLYGFLETVLTNYHYIVALLIWTEPAGLQAF